MTVHRSSSGSFEQRARVRPLERTDLLSVMELERLGHSHPWTQATFLDCFKPNYRLFGVEDERGELIGYAVIAYLVDEAHLLNICVSPNAQGRGLGRWLLRHLTAVALADQMVQMILEVRVSNVVANALYLSEGFSEIGLRRGYYPDGNSREDARVMALRFT
ncbi:ribosomal protein S18-alanine N-acetyltransferase [Marinobacter daepoensis]|uniref:ribosomal protein S18-alanine N-acetyltransferase n=1 Tax=Marinobacter daepoensis TaxID=262077 RepID=UPI001C9449AE|nr:ribosomal protein S18-alanine N-acetyltransferase [Marinobacter daepoensis]MBY6034118.1 ribosomal protein S18-alanine N-acetyltransferase [Marinobacter daepoensis]